MRYEPDDRSDFDRTFVDRIEALEAETERALEGERAAQEEEEHFREATGKRREKRRGKRRPWEEYDLGGEA